MDSSTQACHWKIYSENQKFFLGAGKLMLNLTTVIVSLVLTNIIVRTALLKNRSYWMLLNLYDVFIFRGFIGIFSGASILEERWLFSDSWLLYIGFFKQFTSIYQQEALTHISIDRYVTAKYKKYGWDITIYKYALYLSLCFLFSTLYAVPMLLGIGNYGWDFTCTTYDVLLNLPSEVWKRNLFLFILLMQSLKPVSFIYAMLYWTLEIESEIYDAKIHKQQLEFTKSMVSLEKIAIILSIPNFIMSTFIIMFGAENITSSSSYYFLFATLTSELVPVTVMLSFVLTNEDFQQHFLSKVQIKQKIK